MPQFDIMGQLIRPLGERLISDERFGVAGIKVFYDRKDDEIVEQNLMPAVNYFLQPDWEDITRGSNTATLNDRKVTAQIGFGLWAYAIDKEKLDAALFEMAGNLLDFLREATDFDRITGVAVIGTIRWTPVAVFSEDNNMVGTQRIIAPFELFSGRGV